MGNNKYYENDNGKTIEDILINVDAFLSKPGECSCGGNFEYVGLGRYVCPRCRNEFKNEYAIVRDFVDEYGNAYSILEICEKPGVTKNLIDLFVKDKRFDLVRKQRRCRNCRQPIEKGYYCSKCALLQLSNEMNSEIRKILGSGTKDMEMDGKMHYLSKGKEEKK